MARTFSWDELLSEVSKRIPPQQFRAWLEPIHFLDLNDQHLVIGAPTVFSRDWVNDHYKEVFKTALVELYGLRLDLKVQVSHEFTPRHENSDSSALLAIPHSNLEENSVNQFSDKSISTTAAQAAGDVVQAELSLFDFEQSEKAPSSSAIPSPNNEDFDSRQFRNESVSSALPVRESAIPIVRTLGQPVDPKHTFETFVVGASNQFAHAAARAVADQPATQYNPLFIYSDAGLGKTHLLHAIGNYVLKINPKAKSATFPQKSS